MDAAQRKALEAAGWRFGDAADFLEMPAATERHMRAKWPGIDKHLVCEFLLTFSRHEYALKRCGFVNGDDKKAEPDWDTFANSLRGQFAGVQDPEFVGAVQYLESAPPQKQVLRAGELCWAETVRGASDAQEVWLLRLVRTVRNNLFHGGKYPGAVVNSPERDAKLLQACLTVLRYAAELSPPAKLHLRFDS